MVAAVRVHKVGGPEVLTYEEIDVPAPGAGHCAGRADGEQKAQSVTLLGKWKLR